MQWLIDNKEWLFSGVGVVIITAIFIYIRSRVGFPVATQEMKPEIATKTPIEKCNSVEDARRHTDVRALTRMENGLPLSKLPNGVYGYLAPWLIKSNYGIERSCFGTFTVEVHKAKSGEIFIIGYVSNEAAARLLDPSRQNNVEVYFFHKKDNEAPNLVIIPTKRIIQSSHRDIDHESEILDLKIA